MRWHLSLNEVNQALFAWSAGLSVLSLRLLWLSLSRESLNSVTTYDVADTDGVEVQLKYNYIVPIGIVFCLFFF